MGAIRSGPDRASASDRPAWLRSVPRDVIAGVSVAMATPRQSSPGSPRRRPGPAGSVDTTGALVLRSVLDQARDAGLKAEATGVPPQSEQLTARILNSPTDPLG